MNHFFKKVSSISLTLFFFSNIINFSPSISFAKENYIKNKAELNNIQNFYLLGPSDQLTIKLYKELDTDFSGDYTILNDGSIYLPFIDSVYIQGLTIKQAKEKIEKKLSKELIRPEIYIKLKRAKPSQISVIGHVINPGLYTINNSKTFQVAVGEFVTKDYGFPRLVEIIKEAGGVKSDSDIKNIKLTRRISISPDIQKEFNINLMDLLLKGDQLQNPYLFDGDIIKISKADIYSEDNKLINYRHNILPDNINVNIVGEVIKPGFKKLKPGATLNDAILSAGGPVFAKSNLTNVRLIRTNDNGSVSFKKFKIDFSNKSSKNQNPILRDQDTVVLYKNNIEKGSSVLSVISNPLKDFFSIYTFIKIIEDI